MPRWMSGIRNRSQATRSASPAARRIREPRRSDQRIGHDRHPVAAPPGEVDELDVEHDAGHPLAREHVVRRTPREALEAALRVLDGPDDPHRREQVERLARAGAGRAAGSCACPSRRAGSGCRGRRPRRSSAATSGTSSSGGVAMSASANTIRSPVGGQHPGPDRGALAAVGHGDQRELGSLRVSGGRARGRPSRRCCRRRPRGHARPPAGCADPGAPSRAASPRRCR